MSFAIKDGSTWRYPKAVSIKDGSTWRTVKGLSYKNGSTWRGTNLIAAVTGATLGSLNGFGLGYGSISNGFGMDGVELYELGYSTGTLQTYVFLRTSGSTLLTVAQTNYLKLITVSGTTVNTSSAVNFAASGSPVDHGHWYFTGDVFGMVAAAGTTFSVQLTLA